MWTRGAKDKTNGGIRIECRDWSGALFYAGTFSNVLEANRAGEDAERRMTSAMIAGDMSPLLPASISDMSDDELLKELMS